MSFLAMGYIRRCVSRRPISSILVTVRRHSSPPSKENALVSPIRIQVWESSVLIKWASLYIVIGLQMYQNTSFEHKCAKYLRHLWSWMLHCTVALNFANSFPLCDNRFQEHCFSVTSVKLFKGWGQRQTAGPCQWDGGRRRCGRGWPTCRSSPGSGWEHQLCVQQRI